MLTRARRNGIRAVLALVITIGLVAGAMLGLHVFEEHERAAEQEKHLLIDMEQRLDAFSASPEILLEGWQRPEDWGTWIQREKATLSLLTPGTTDRDVELVLEARADIKASNASIRLTVSVNSTIVGDWPLSNRNPDPRRRFIIPQDVFNSVLPAKLELQIKPATAGIKVGLRSLTIREVNRLSEFNGHIDSCAGQKLSGWAVAEALAVPVIAMIDDKPVAANLTAVDRPDLEKHGFPADAGFDLTLVKPAAAGSEIKVVFYGSDGRSLAGSPCRQ